MNEIALMEAASSVYKRKYQCPYCNDKYDRVKLVDHIDRLKRVTLPEEKKASIFSKIGNALGLNNEIKTKSLIYNSRIKKLIHTIYYFLLD